MQLNCDEEASNTHRGLEVSTTQLLLSTELLDKIRSIITIDGHGSIYFNPTQSKPQTFQPNTSSTLTQPKLTNPMYAYGVIKCKKKYFSNPTQPLGEPNPFPSLMIRQGCPVIFCIPKYSEQKASTTESWPGSFSCLNPALRWPTPRVKTTHIASYRVKFGLDPVKIRRVLFDSLKCHILPFKTVLG